MKNSAATEVEVLRAEVRRLQFQVSQLQARLAEPPARDRSEPPRWVRVYSRAKDWLRQTDIRRRRWLLTLHNRRTVRAHPLTGGPPNLHVL